MTEYFHVKPHFGEQLIGFMTDAVQAERERRSGRRDSYQQGFSVSLALDAGEPGSSPGICSPDAWTRTTSIWGCRVTHCAFTSKEEAMLALHGEPGMFHFYLKARHVVLAPWNLTLIQGPLIMLQARPDALRWVDFDAPETWKYSRVG